MFKKDKMFFRFALYGFLKNLRFFEPFLVLFFREQSLSFFEIGLLYAIRDMATNFLEIPTGVFADTFGRRKAMLMAFGSYIGSFFIFYVFPNFYVYILAMLFFALGEAFRTGTHKALILEHLKLNNMRHLKVEYYGRTRAVSQLGSALNSLVAATLVFYTGSYRYIFIASTLPYVLDFINLSTYPPALDGELVKLNHGAIDTQIKATLQTFGGLFKDPATMRAILNSSGFDAFYKATKDYLQPILKTFAIALPLLLRVEDTQRSALIIGVIYFFIYLMSSYASRSAATFSKQFSNIARAINVTFFIGAGLLFVAGVASWRNIALLSILVFLGLYLLHNVRRPMNVAFISDQISSQVMASGLSVESQATTLLMAIISPILGALADAWGVGSALACIGGVMLVTAFLARVSTQPGGEVNG